MAKRSTVASVAVRPAQGKRLTFNDDEDDANDPLIDGPIAGPSRVTPQRLEKDDESDEDVSDEDVAPEAAGIINSAREELDEAVEAVKRKKIVAAERSRKIAEIKAKQAVAKGRDDRPTGKVNASKRARRAGTDDEPEADTEDDDDRGDDALDDESDAEGSGDGSFHTDPDDDTEEDEDDGEDSEELREDGPLDNATVKMRARMQAAMEAADRRAGVRDPDSEQDDDVDEEEEVGEDDEEGAERAVHDEEDDSTWDLGGAKPLSAAVLRAAVKADEERRHRKVKKEALAATTVKRRAKEAKQRASKRRKVEPVTERRLSEKTMLHLLEPQLSLDPNALPPVLDSRSRAAGTDPRKKFMKNAMRQSGKIPGKGMVDGRRKMSAFQLKG